MGLKSRLFNILFWALIAAAFIGPGTITTAAKAGASFNFALLWALVFSTFACLILQEASSRITLVSGVNLGQAIAKKFEKKRSKWLVLSLVVGAIIVGSAAYQTGNLLGAVAGLELISSFPKKLLIALIVLLAFLALSIPSLKILARLLGFVVALMGLFFFIAAFLIQPDFSQVLKGSFLPTFPENAEASLLILALIGTTVVPYNLFLGSGISDTKQSLKEMRFGLTVAIVLGGLISMAVVVVGSAVEGIFSFENLAQVLENKIGFWGIYLLGLGLFAAGFSSAITAPLAAAITAKSLFGNFKPQKWTLKSLNFKSVWILVLFTGLVFSWMNFKPIPIIILAQALNGLILPFIAIFLIFLVNDKKLLKEHCNGWKANLAMALVVWVSLVLGFNNLIKAVAKIIDLENLLNWNLFLASIISLFIFWKVHRFRIGNK